MSGRSSSESSDSIDVRRIRPDEWREHREIRLKALACDPLAFGSTHSRELGYSDDLWKERTERGALSESSALFVADHGGKGFVGMMAVAGSEGQWHVFAMWVTPERRRRGIGSRLLDAGLAWFRERAPPILYSLRSIPGRWTRSDCTNVGDSVELAAPPRSATEKVKSRSRWCLIPGHTSSQTRRECSRPPRDSLRTTMSR